MLPIRHQHPAGFLFTRDQRTRIGGNLMNFGRETRHIAVSHVNMAAVFKRYRLIFTIF